LQRHRFHILLGTLVLLLVSGPVVHLLHPISHPLLARIAVVVAFTAVLLSAVLAVSQTRLTGTIAITLAVPTVLLQCLTVIVPWHGIEVAVHVFGILTLAYIAIVILGHLFSVKHITFDMISASLCVYLVLGVLWADIYSLTELLEPGSFHFNLAEDKASGQMRFGAEKTILPIYFSYVTLTTLGYGDIVPVSPAARMFAIVEAVVGQLYLAVLVARLVGLHISHSATGGRPRHPQ
jgi:voltage-gated potassium channel